MLKKKGKLTCWNLLRSFKTCTMNYISVESKEPCWFSILLCCWENYTCLIMKKKFDMFSAHSNLISYFICKYFPTLLHNECGDWNAINCTNYTKKTPMKDGGNIRGKKAAALNTCRKEGWKNKEKLGLKRGFLPKMISINRSSLM